jgi:hypothetical protein
MGDWDGERNALLRLGRRVPLALGRLLAREGHRLADEVLLPARLVKLRHHPPLPGPETTACFFAVKRRAQPNTREREQLTALNKRPGRARTVRARRPGRRGGLGSLGDGSDFIAISPGSDLTALGATSAA